MKMVFDVIAFAAGVYFGFKHPEGSLSNLVERGLPYNIGLAAALTTIMFFTYKLEAKFSSFVVVLGYLFLIFIFGSLAGKVSRRMLRRSEEGEG
jgi:hypothetical protein